MTIEVAAFMTTMNFLASSDTEAAPSAFGVSVKPAMMSTLSRTTSSWARRFATSGAGPPSSLTMSSIFFAGNGFAVLLHVGLDAIEHLDASIGELAGQ